MAEWIQAGYALFVLVGFVVAVLAMASPERFLGPVADLANGLWGPLVVLLLVGAAAGVYRRRSDDE